MKNKILNLAKSVVEVVLCLLVGALAIEVVCSLANRKNLQRNLVQQYLLRMGMTICLWTRNTEFVLFTQRAALVIRRSSI